jgi:hypothetical protein
MVQGLHFSTYVVVDTLGIIQRLGADFLLLCAAA